MTTTLRVGPVDASPPGGTVRRTRDREEARLGASRLLLGLALLLAWALVYLTVLSGFEQSHAQSGLYSRLRTDLAAGTAPTAAPIPAGDPVALLTVPDAGVDGLVVVEGSRPQQLQDGPGHVLGSVLPGQRGTSVVAGRSLSFGAPFGRIAASTVGTVSPSSPRRAPSPTASSAPGARATPCRPSSRTARPCCAWSRPTAVPCRRTARSSSTRC